MSKIPKINSRQEKNDIIIYCRSNTYRENITENEKSIIRQKSKNFTVINDLLYVNQNNIHKIYICNFEEDKINLILKEKHEIDHIGGFNLFTRINEKYIGITRKMCVEFVRRCLACQRAERNIIVPEITPIITTRPRKRLIVDAVSLRQYAEQNDGYKYIFTFIDSFTKFGWAYKARDKSAQTFEKILKAHITNEGLWSILHTDNGREFINANIQTLTNFYKIEHITGRPYHPQSQGQVERFNGTIKQRLRRCLVDINRWIDILPNIIFEYNSCPHRATKIKPFVLFKSHDPAAFLYLQERNTIVNFDEIFDKMNDYIRKWVDEYKLRVINQTLTINDTVLIAKPYLLPRRFRMEPLISLYEEDTYTIISILVNEVKVKNNASLIEKIVRKDLVKRINQ